MSYQFRGKLRGFVCPECPEPIVNVTIWLYRSRTDQNVTALTVANPRDTFAILTDEVVAAKKSSLIAETQTDAGGNFSFTLGPQQKYNGEAFDIDVYCGTGPGPTPLPTPPSPLQFSITTIQPMWRKQGDDFVFGWEYCLPSRFWCNILSRFGLLDHLRASHRVQHRGVGRPGAGAGVRCGLAAG